MTSDQESEKQLAEPMPAARQLSRHVTGCYRLASLLFARNASSESVETRVHFNASPEAVWDHIMFYEEFRDARRSFFASFCPAPYELKATRLGLGPRSVAHTEEVIW